MSALPLLRWQTALADLEAAMADVPAEDVPELAGRLEALKLRLVLRLQEPPATVATSKEGEDRLLDADQAAVLLGTKKSWIYDHKAELSPIRLPGRILRFSELRLRRWLRRTA